MSKDNNEGTRGLPKDAYDRWAREVHWQDAVKARVEMAVEAWLLGTSAGAQGHLGAHDIGQLQHGLIAELGSCLAEL